MSDISMNPPRFAELLAILIVINVASGCQGRGGRIADPQSVSEPESDDGTSLPNLQSGEEVAKGLEATAEGIKEYPTEDHEQETAVEEAVTSVRELSTQFVQLKPGMDISKIKIWLLARDRELARLKAAARKARNAGLTALAAAIDELSARRDVLAMRRALPIGKRWCLPLAKCKRKAFRHAYVVSGDSADQAQLSDYYFVGIPFQVFEKSLVSRGQNISKPIYQCQMEVTESKQWLGGFLKRRKRVTLFFLDPASDCHGQIVQGTLGYVGNEKGIVTARPLQWVMRWKDAQDDDNSDYTDSLTIPSLEVAQALVADTDRNFHFVSAPQVDDDGNQTPIGFVP